jgi:hypothetical protein
MMTGEYFLSEKTKELQKKEKKREQKEQRKESKAIERNQTLEAPEEQEAVSEKYINRKPSSVDDLKQKFLKKK